jgi:hypothetical protein
MKALSKSDKDRLLRRLFWDLKIDAGQIGRMIDGDIDHAGAIKNTDVYYRLLTSYDWYTLLKIMPKDKLEQLLDDSVIKRLKSKSLADKYVYARNFLSK